MFSSNATETEFTKKRRKLLKKIRNIYFHWRIILLVAKS